MRPAAIGQSGAMEGWAVFETRIGTCGLAWGGKGLTGVQLPEADEAVTRGRLGKRFPTYEEASPPGWVEAAIEVVRLLLRGEGTGSSVKLDVSSIGEFDRRVYEAARLIPMGRTITYGEMARSLGDPRLSRAVGQSLGRNPWPILVPCHRILSAGGGRGGFSAFGGADTKMRLLHIEGALAETNLPLFGDRSIEAP